MLQGKDKARPDVARCWLKRLPHWCWEPGAQEISPKLIERLRSATALARHGEMHAVGELDAIEPVWLRLRPRHSGTLPRLQLALSTGCVPRDCRLANSSPNA
jgi:hypothetical protein